MYPTVSIFGFKWSLVTFSSLKKKYSSILVANVSFCRTLFIYATRLRLETYNATRAEKTNLIGTAKLWLKIFLILRIAEQVLCLCLKNTHFLFNFENSKFNLDSFKYFLWFYFFAVDDIDNDSAVAYCNYMRN